MQAAGYAAAPFTAGESLVLVGAGKAVENTGSVINGMLDLSDGKCGKVAGNVIVGAAFGTLGSKVEAMKDAGKLSNESSGIMQFIMDAYEKTANTIVNAVSNRNNEKKK